MSRLGRLSRSSTPNFGWNSFARYVASPRSRAPHDGCPVRVDENAGGRGSETFSPPYFDFHLKNVALPMPCLRQTSTVFDPTSCSRKIAMICFQRLRGLRPRSPPIRESCTLHWSVLPKRPDSNPRRRKISVAGHQLQDRGGGANK